MNTPVPPTTDLPFRETKYRELEQYPEFGFVTTWLRDLIPTIVPNARMSEREYWSVSCLPDCDPADPRRLLLTVHAGNFDVAGVFLAPGQADERLLGGYVLVSTPELERCAGAPVADLAASFAALSFHVDGPLVSIGWVLTPASREQFDALPWRPAARSLVAELMRNGRNSRADSHCPQIAQFGFVD